MKDTRSYGFAMGYDSNSTGNFSIAIGKDVFTDPSLFVDENGNGHLMGEEIPAEELKNMRKYRNLEKKELGDILPNIIYLEEN